MSENKLTMDKLVALCKGRGFIFAGSEIYGGLANTWDYGPLGVELKNNIKRAWWKKFVQENRYNVGLDAAILMNPQTWVASGHLAGFSDPLLDCRECHERFRADKLIEDWCSETGFALSKPIDAFTQPEMKAFIEEHNIPCPTCKHHNFTDIRQFNLMFKTFQGVTEDAKNTVYLRPETAQGIFTNFVNVQRSSRKKMPFGIGQIGKSFRNEITPGNFIFRVREFEQMELEFFCKPGTDLEWFSYWRNFCHEWLLSLGFKDENLRLRDHSLGVERTVLAVLCNAYDEEVVDAEKNDVRTVLHLHPALAPVKAAVLPLSKKLAEPAQKVADELGKYFNVEYDETGSIGKRYRRQDEIGTPYCVTVDFDTLEDNAVTVRDRDTMQQVRMPISQLKAYLDEKLFF
ncbi:MAG: glycine--tRNA ligase [Firmicutes bacterium]|nr:glycine--tRNA ligase [Bacillota bacterium]